MEKTKSIEKTLKVLIFSSVVIFIIFFFLRNYLTIFEYKLILSAIFLFFLLNLVLIVSQKNAKKIMATIALTFLAYLPLSLYFRHIRNFFPKPELAGSDWVGFANYFGYPLYFDNFLFFLLLFIPIAIYLGISRYENKKS